VETFHLAAKGQLLGRKEMHPRGMYRLQLSRERKISDTLHVCCESSGASPWRWCHTPLPITTTPMRFAWLA